METKAMDTRSSRRGILAYAILCAMTPYVMATTSPASAHDGVKLEQDTCVVKVGPVTVHFIGYPQKGEPQEYCDDIALTGPTVIALSAMESNRLPDSYMVQNQTTAAVPSSEAAVDLREIAIGVRIVKDAGGEESSRNAEADTEFYAPPKIYRNATMTFEHDFKEAGNYVAIIAVADREGREWSSRFPFTVGIFSLWNTLEYILYGIGFFSLIGALWLFAWRRRAKPAEPQDVAAEVHAAE
jgi:hypothetical protein